jgi:drug/metabolite transporter (DMT)-like permease
VLLRIERGLYAADTLRFAVAAIRSAQPACDNRRVSPPAAGRSILRGANPYLLLTLTAFCWSCNWIVGRGLSATMPPFALTFFRWFFALLILAPFALPRLPRDWPVIRRSWKIMLFLGATGVAGQNTLVYLGLNYTTATNGIVLNPFIPVLIITLSWLFLREPLSLPQALGVVISLGGVLAIVAHGSLESLASLRFNGGDLIVVLSMVMWAVYTIALRWGPRGLDPLVFLFTLACCGVICVLPGFIAEIAFGRPMVPSVASFAALAGVALFASVLAYVFWNHGVERVGANVAGLFIHLMPAFGVVLAWIFLDERLHLYHVAGIALILTGIWLTSRRGRPAARMPSGPD